MQETGITKRDLEIERETGYKDGQNSDFYLSACYASTGIVLHERHGLDSPRIRAFLDRVEEIIDDEISVTDINERAKDETGVDVSGYAERAYDY